MSVLSAHTLWLEDLGWIFWQSTTQGRATGSPPVEVFIIYSLYPFAHLPYLGRCSAVCPLLPHNRGRIFFTCFMFSFHLHIDVSKQFNFPQGSNLLNFLPKSTNSALKSVNSKLQSKLWCAINIPFQYPLLPFRHLEASFFFPALLNLPNSRVMETVETALIIIGNSERG